MIFVKNLKFLPNLIFFAQGLGMMFDDVLHRKEDFIAYKNATLSQSKNKHFSWGGGINHDFGQKFEISSEFFLKT